MLKPSVISIIGEHFYLQSRLLYSEDQGYSLEKSLCGRIVDPENLDLPLRETSAALLINPRISLNLENLSSKTVKTAEERFVNPLELINKELKEKTLIIELNFSSFSLINAAVVMTIPVKLTKLTDHQEFKSLLKRLGLQEQLVFNSLQKFPVIPNTIAEHAVHDYIFNYFSQSLFNLNESYDQVIFTGEMVWSGWFSTYEIIRFLDRHINNNAKVIIDKSGVWQTLLHLHQELPELFKISREFFQDQLFYIFDTKLFTEKDTGTMAIPIKRAEEKRRLLLDPEKLNYFDLQKKGFWLSDKVTRLTRYVFIKLLKFPEWQAFSNKRVQEWWKDFPPRNFLTGDFQTCIYNKISIDDKELRVDFPGEISVDKQKNRFVAKDEQIGSIKNKVKAILDYRKGANFLKDLLVSKGQMVELGEKLAVVRKMGSLIKQTVAAPVKGIVNLDEIEQGTIMIEQQDEPLPLFAPFAAQMLRFTKNNQVIFRTQCLQIPLFKNVGPNCSGVLTLPDKPADKQAKIILLEKLSEYKYSLKDLEVLKINGVIVLSTNETELLGFIKKFGQHLHHISLFVLDEFSAPVDEKLRMILGKLLGRYVVLQKDSLNIPLEQGELKLLKEQLIIQRKKLFKGNYVKFLNYRYNRFYASVENEPVSGSFLLNNGEGYFEANIANIISLNYG